MTDILLKSMTAQRAALAAGELTSVALVAAHLEQISRLDGTLRAFITVDAKGARAAAAEADRRRAQGDTAPLLGLPVSVKDLVDTKDLRTTYGSATSDHVPAEDDLIVARLRAAGAVIIGKTNTPEFGFGAICQSPAGGTTCNPWNPKLTSGGSSGGAAVATVTGMSSLALGTDFGGSVRTPASFCGCWSLRPTPGRLPEPKRPLAFSSLATQGFLTRAPEDLELALNVLSGPSPLDPVSERHWPEPPSGPLRIAASDTLNGAYPIDAEVSQAFAAAVTRLESVFGKVSATAPDVTGGVEAFKTLRAAESWFKFGKLVTEHPDQVSPTFAWNVKRGAQINAEQTLGAEVVRSRVYRAFMSFFEDHDVLVTPAASVLPWSNEISDVSEVGGEPTQTIIDYLACTFLISLVGMPVLCAPIGQTPEGLPFGVQLIARPGAEATLFAAARQMTQAGITFQAPPTR